MIPCSGCVCVCVCVCALKVPLTQRPGHCPLGGNALEGKGPQRDLQKRLGRRLEEVAKAVGGGYCRLQTPWRLALGVTGTVAGRRLGALEGGGGADWHPWKTTRLLVHGSPLMCLRAATMCAHPWVSLLYG